MSPAVKRRALPRAQRMQPGLDCILSRHRKTGHRHTDHGRRHLGPHVDKTAAGRIVMKTDA
jgi:hypothetical protein